MSEFQGPTAVAFPLGNDDIHDDFEREVRLIPQQVLDPPDRPSPIRFMTMFSRFVDLRVPHLFGHGLNASPSATPEPQIDYCSKNNLELIRMPRSCHWSPCLISESWISAGPDSNSAFAVYAAEITFPCWVVTDMLACPLAPS